MAGRTIKIHLVDGTASSIITAEIMNWTGKVIVAPRSQLAVLGKRNDLNKTGIYFLTGKNPEDPSQEFVYIGESDNVWKRLTKHDSDQDKEFWERTLIVTSNDRNLTKGHVKYLESRLIKITSQVKRAKLNNSNTPEIPNLPESDTADMEYFLEQVRMLLPVLGSNFATAIPIPTLDKNQGVQSGVQIEAPVFCLNFSGVDASAQEIDGEFVVIRNSTARKADTPSLTLSYKQARNRLLKEGKLTDSKNNDYWIFTDDVPFSSPSYATNVVNETRLNGRFYWKMKGGDQTYAEWQESKIREVDKSKVKSGVYEDRT